MALGTKTEIKKAEAEINRVKRAAKKKLAAEKKLVNETKTPK
jgi:hypothetical protein